MANRRMALVVLVLLVVGAVVVVLDGPWSIDSYRVVDDHTIVVTTGLGWLDWTRITSVKESPDSVTVSMRSFRPPLPGTGGPATDFTVMLVAPLGARDVVDAASGQTVFRRP